MFSPASLGQSHSKGVVYLQSIHGSQIEISELFQKRKNSLESEADLWHTNIQSFFISNSNFSNNTAPKDIEFLKPDLAQFNPSGSGNKTQKHYSLQEPSNSKSYAKLSFEDFQLSEEKPQLFAKPSRKNDSIIHKWKKDDPIFRGKFSTGATPKPEKMDFFRFFQSNNPRNKLKHEDKVKNFVGTPIPQKCGETKLYNYPKQHLENAIKADCQSSKVEDLDFDRFKTTKFVKTDLSTIQENSKRSSHNIAAFVRDNFADNLINESSVEVSIQSKNTNNGLERFEVIQNNDCALKLEARGSSKKCRRKLFNDSQMIDSPYKLNCNPINKCSEGISPTQARNSKKGLLKKSEILSSEANAQLYSNLSRDEFDFINSLNENMQSIQNPILSSRLQSDYENIEVIGSGHFGKVYKCLNKIDGLLYAVKSIKYKKKGISYMSQAINEVQALASLSCLDDNINYIVRYYNVWIEDETLYIVMEYCPNNLRNIENEHKIFSDSMIRQMLRDVCMGLNQLHRQRIVHLDIKPENILYSRTNKYKIADLGLSRIAEIQVGEDINEGDSRYLAPELLKDSSENLPDLTKADIFSLGMTVYELMTGQELPKNGPEWREIRSGNLSRLEKLSNYSQSLKKIVEQMVAPNPDERPSAQEILNNWLKSDLELELQTLKSQNEILQIKIKEYEQKLSLQRKMSL